MKKSILILIVLTILSCQKQPSDVQLKSIDISASINNQTSILASSFVDEFEYIRLETSNKTLYKNPESSKISILQDSLILLKNFRVIALFNRKTGSFIRDISQYGDSPNSYKSASGVYQVNNNDTIVFAKGSYGLIGFDMQSGMKTLSLPFPKDSLNYQAVEIANRVRLNDSTFVANFPNGSGTQKLRLMTYSADGVIHSFFPRKLFYDNDPKFSFYSPKDVFFYKYDGKVFFKEAFNDTVFSISTSSLTPDFRFDLGSFAPNYEDQEYLARRENKEKRDEYMFITRMIQLDDNLVFYVRHNRKDYLGFYNQKTNSTQISNGVGDDEFSGFVNDIDGFIPFAPDYVDDQGNIICTVSAERVYTWFQKNQERIESLPKHIRQFQNFQPEDNPLIMIGRKN